MSESVESKASNTKTITIVIIIIVPHHKLLQKIIENYTFKMRSKFFGENVLKHTFET